MYNIDKYRELLKNNCIDDSVCDYLYKALLEEDRLDDFDKCIDLIIKGNPVQYVVGNVNFYGYKIKVDENVLIPRFETELLVEKSIKYINKLFNKRVNILDIGTGSGCISIVLKKELDCCVTACDISDGALRVASDNAKYNNVDIKFVKSDIFSNIDGIFDVIISNPPYISYDEDIMDIVKNNEPDIALYAPSCGLYFYREIISNCSRILNSKYLICFEIGYNQGDSIRELVHKYFKDVNVSVEKDYNNRDRFVFIWNSCRIKT